MGTDEAADTSPGQGAGDGMILDDTERKVLQSLFNMFGNEPDVLDNILAIQPIRRTA
jgi:hypothetical protein